MGVALGFEKKYAEAIASLEAAASTLNKTMANLKGKSGKLAKMEVIEIEALIPEIKAKIADTVDMKEGKVEVNDLKGSILIIVFVLKVVSQVEPAWTRA